MKTQQFTISFFCLLLSSLTLGQANDSVAIQDEIELSRQLLQELEDSVGRLDMSLVESMDQITSRLVSLRQFEEAHSMLDRALHITRINQGLHTQNQLPYLGMKIESYANQGDWGAARQQMLHLESFYRINEIRVDGELIDELLRFSDLHLRGIAEDGGAWQDYHFRQAASLNWVALQAAELAWGESDPRLVPILYRQISHLHLQNVAVDHGGSTGYALRKLLPGSSYVRDKDLVRTTHFFTGAAMLNRISQIYNNAEPPELEALAMSRLYLADWQALFNRPAEAVDTYRAAYAALLDAGGDRTQIDELFSEPAILPTLEFFPSVAAAIASRGAQQAGDEIEPSARSSATLSFREWSSAFSNAPSPNLASIAEKDSNFALFSFTLVGVNQVSRWFRGSYTKTVNVIEEAELLNQLIGTSATESELLEKLDLLRFRPMFIDGEPQQASGMLKYHLAEGASN